ncbi:hypothetical protein DNK48_06575 [Streptomyces malaysiensis subsp. malaysiensis]|nr:hypothetical protein DNK48_06575 [Streptomyces malaysiensis]
MERSSSTSGTRETGATGIGATGIGATGAGAAGTGATGRGAPPGADPARARAEAGAPVSPGMAGAGAWFGAPAAHWSGPLDGESRTIPRASTACSRVTASSTRTAAAYGPPHIAGRFVLRPYIMRPPSLIPFQGTPHCGRRHSDYREKSGLSPVSVIFSNAYIAAFRGVTGRVVRSFEQ